MSNSKQYLESLIKWDRKKSFDLSLIRELVGYLGNVQDSTPSVHIAGTNGKGSVGVYISSILAKEYTNVGFSISPHLYSVNERFIVNGFPVDAERLDRGVSMLKRVLDETGLEPSYFEGLTALAFIIFSELDMAVYEVGLGGRLDASNVLSKPRVSVITSIGLDHQHILGETIEEIAIEKAGIMRKDSVMVTGPLKDRCLKLIQQKADDFNTELLVYGRDFALEQGSTKGLVYSDKKGRSLEVAPSLAGKHQAENAAVAIAACNEMGLSIESCKQGVKDAFWPARLEKVRCCNRDLILDCAHNEAAVERLISFLDSQDIENIDIIYSSLDSKPWQNMCKMLKPYIVNWHIVQPDVPTAVPSDEIATYIRELGEENVSFYGRNFEELFKNIEGEKRKLLVTGSMYFVGEFRAKLNLEERPYWIAMKP